MEKMDGYVPYPPKVFRIEPSGACNLKCIHCPTGCVPMKRGIMPLDTFQKILKEIEDAPPKVAVLYHGGEPFLNKNIFDMIKSIKALGVQTVKTVSNGMLITYEMLPKILESGLDIIEFSLDGSNPNENNKIRCGSDYSKVSSIIKELLKLKEDTKSQIDIFITNIQIPTEKELYETKGQANVPRYLLEDFSEYVEKNLIKFKCFYPIIWPGYPVDEAKYKIVVLAFNTTVDSLYCDHVHNTITIRWTGDVVGCCYDIISSFILGNIFDSPLKEIWNNEKYRSLRRSICTNKFLSMCKYCSEVNPPTFFVRR